MKLETVLVITIILSCIIGALFGIDIYNFPSENQNVIR